MMIYAMIAQLLIRSLVITDSSRYFLACILSLLCNQFRLKVILQKIVLILYAREVLYNTNFLQCKIVRIRSNLKHLETFLWMTVKTIAGMG